MIKFLKFIGIIIILAINITVVEKWYHIILNGNYFQNASFIASVMLGFVLPVVILYFSYLGIREIIKIKIK
jgi:hypothetical protein